MSEHCADIESKAWYPGQFPVRVTTAMLTPHHHLRLILSQSVVNSACKGSPCSTFGSLLCWEAAEFSSPGSTRQVARIRQHGSPADGGSYTGLVSRQVSTISFVEISWSSEPDQIS